MIGVLGGWDRRVALAVLALLPFVFTLEALAAGHVWNENFSVISPAQKTKADSQAYAQRVLATAERYRKEIALEWLGKTLPDGVGRTHINVAFSETEDSGITWPVDGNRQLHTLLIASTPEGSLGATLKHEISHIVLCTRFPRDRRLPRWVEEGIACRYDDRARKRDRQSILAWWIETQNWPNVASVMRRTRLAPNDLEAYTVAESLTAFLLTRSDRATLISYAQDGSEQALQSHYGITISELQIQWQTWLSK